MTMKWGRTFCQLYVKLYVPTIVANNATGGVITTYTYDALGRKTGETAPDGSTISYEYDLQGRLTKKTVGNNVPETYTYDVFDNLISKQRDGESINYTYNAVGARTSMTDSTGTTNYAYDSFGNLTTEAKNGIVKSYTYDVLGNRTSFNAANGENSVIGNTYAYDNMGRLTSVTNGADTVSYTYDANSNRLSTALNGTVTNTATYNKGNLPVEIKNFDGGTLVDTTAFAYYFDGNVRNQVVTTANDSTSTNYRYDGVGRLTKERTYSESYTFDYTNEYFYDNYGNRRIFTQTDDQKNTKTSVKYTFDSKNKLVKSHFSCYNSDTSQTRSVNTNYTYDDFGNTVSVTENDELAKTYTYDAFNRLSTYTADGITASYTYDGDNLRQSKTVNGSTVNHLLDGANVVADIYPDSTNIYVYGNGVELFKTGGQTSRYTKSYRGDVTTVTTGDERTEYFYDNFGNKQKDTDTSTNPFEYCGEYFDDETGLIYLRNRYYDPTIGRFITEDPIRDGENWYVYAGNNPVNFVDPWGLVVTRWDRENLSPSELNQIIENDRKWAEGNRTEKESARQSSYNIRKKHLLSNQKILDNGYVVENVRLPGYGTTTNYVVEINSSTVIERTYTEKIVYVSLKSVEVQVDTDSGFKVDELYVRSGQNAPRSVKKIEEWSGTKSHYSFAPSWGSVFDDGGAGNTVIGSYIKVTVSRPNSGKKYTVQVFNQLYCDEYVDVNGKINLEPDLSGMLEDALSRGERG